jgi:hypothetical protein
MRRPALFLLVASLSGSALAADPAKDEAIRLDRPALVGDTVIPAGDYRIRISPGLNEVTLTQGKRTVAVVPASVELTRPVYPGNAVHYRTEGDPDRVVRIVFAKSRLSVEFGPEIAGTGDPSVTSVADRP